MSMAEEVAGMNTRRRSLLRVLGAAVLAAGLVGGSWAVADAATAPTPIPVNGSAVGRPALVCCPPTVAGLTATGRATLRGTGTRVRDAAIRAAVADALDQAHAAAAAARVTLGRILSMQVDASGYPYPVPLEAPGGVATTPGSAGACPPGAPCPTPVPTTFVTVVVTWAIS